MLFRSPLPVLHRQLIHQLPGVIRRLVGKRLHLPMSPVRAEFYGRLRKKIKVLNAESIYLTMQEMELSEIEYERLCREFCRDDHSRWEKEDEKKSPNPNRNRKNDWDDKREKMQAEME